MTLAVLVDVLVIALLGVAIVAMALVMRRLGALRAERGEFERLVSVLGEALRQADASTAALKSGVVAAAEGLERPLARAQALKDELAFLTERAERLSQSLEGVASSRPGPAAAPAVARERIGRELPAALAQMR